MHPRCYVAERGLDALLTLIGISDNQQRHTAFQAHMTIMELKQRLARDGRAGPADGPMRSRSVSDAQEQQPGE
jgi:hypothetical protein